MRKLQSQIIQALGVTATVEPADEIRTRIRFMVDYLAATGAKGYVLGISGGQDSSLLGRLAQLACEQARSEGLEARFVAVRLPYGVQHDEADAQLALSFITPDETVTCDIKPGTDGLVGSVVDGVGRMSDFNKGNVKARMRMVAQYAIAGDRKLLVLGTDHAAEAVTGFFTKFGDGAVDLTPLSGLNKRQGRALLRELSTPTACGRRCPRPICSMTNPVETDEANLGLAYDDIDDYLEGREVDVAVAERIERTYWYSRHKRQTPPAPWDSWWREPIPADAGDQV